MQRVEPEIVRRVCIDGVMHGASMRLNSTTTRLPLFGISRSSPAPASAPQQATAAAVCRNRRPQAHQQRNLGVPLVQRSGQLGCVAHVLVNHAVAQSSRRKCCASSSTVPTRKARRSGLVTAPRQWLRQVRARVDELWVGERRCRVYRPRLRQPGPSLTLAGRRSMGRPDEHRTQ